MEQLQASSVKLREKNKNANCLAAAEKQFAAAPGFSLIEMIVAVGLFAIVMLISVTALLALVNANRKARALESVINNLNITLDGMVRAIRMGTLYECGGTTPVGNPGGGGNDCPDGAHYMSFLPYGASTNEEAWVYSNDYVAKRLMKSEDGGVHYTAVTAPEISIDDMQFYIVGTARGVDNVQPKVVITIKGTAGGEDARVRTTFSIQATAVQRALDL